MGVPLINYISDTYSAQYFLKKSHYKLSALFYVSQF